MQTLPPLFHLSTASNNVNLITQSCATILFTSRIKLNISINQKISKISLTDHRPVKPQCNPRLGIETHPRELLCVPNAETYLQAMKVPRMAQPWTSPKRRLETYQMAPIRGSLRLMTVFQKEKSNEGLAIESKKYEEV